MTKQELEILEKMMDYAEEYFTSYCEFADCYVYEQDDIDNIDDEDEKINAQNNRDYEDLLNQARKIINKYKEVK